MSDLTACLIGLPAFGSASVGINTSQFDPATFSFMRQILFRLPQEADQCAAFTLIRRPRGATLYCADARARSLPRFSFITPSLRIWRLQHHWRLALMLVFVFVRRIQMLGALVVVSWPVVGPEDGRTVSNGYTGPYSKSFGGPGLGTPPSPFYRAYEQVAPAKLRLQDQDRNWSL